MNHHGHLRIAFGSALALLVSMASFWIKQEYQKYPNAFERLQRGTSKADVVRAFGTPREVTKCSDSPTWDDTPLQEPSASCVEEYHYYSRLQIGEWTVGFDANGKAVAKSYRSSP